MANFLITGGSGMVGSALATYLLKRGHRVTILTRSRASSPSREEGIQYRYWDPYKEAVDEDAIREADYIVHLAGANVAEKRWTPKRKREIQDSRIQSGKFLAALLQRIPNRVKAVLGASAQGWYGPDPVIPNHHPFVENDPSHPDFLGETCKLWEESLHPVFTMGIRLIQLRIGIVLSRKGGAFFEFYKPVRFGITPVLGDGRQVISWIHIQDLVALIEWALLNEKIQGVYNAAAPNPVSNKILMRALASAAHRPFIPIPVPAFFLKIALGEMSIEVLKSTTMCVEKLVQAGYEFKFPAIKEALADLMKCSD